MEVIILAGGFGTRLQSVIKDIPKAMADINGKPFLWYLLIFLQKWGVTKVIISVGYKQAFIKEYFKNSFLEMEIVYSSEEKPLGTGGAIKKALAYTVEKAVLVLNGDTFFDFSLVELYEKHKSQSSKITLGLKPMQNFDRYGSVEVDDSIITSFEEKKFKKFGLINAGAYLIDNDLFDTFDIDEERFSFEKDFLEKYLHRIKPTAYLCDGYFVDIGVPEDYEKAKKELNDYI
ncbi:MAG: nucleotidyltransferase family protein [Sulfuricurvum sp.]|nr:nucleotidyltransferase family protein [Sulfuricurvum sp.]